MPRSHIVRQGECLATIARRYGCPDWRDIYEHGDNAALREKRPDPHVLYPGDVVEIPDFEIEEHDCATEQKHRFTLEREELLFRLWMEDDDDQPLGGLPYELCFEDTVYTGNTAPDGLIEHPIDAGFSRGILKLWLYGDKSKTDPIDIPVNLGHLDPVDTISGAQSRLANLGFFHRAITDVLCDATKCALEIFQEKHGLTVSGELDGATQDKLKALAEG